MLIWIVPANSEDFVNWLMLDLKQNPIFISSSETDFMIHVPERNRNQAQDSSITISCSYSHQAENGTWTVCFENVLSFHFARLDPNRVQITVRSDNSAAVSSYCQQLYAEIINLWPETQERDAELIASSTERSNREIEREQNIKASLEQHAADRRWADASIKRFTLNTEPAYFTEWINAIALSLLDMQFPKVKGKSYYTVSSLGRVVLQPFFGMKNHLQISGNHVVDDQTRQKYIIEANMPSLVSFEIVQMAPARIMITARCNEPALSPAYDYLLTQIGESYPESGLNLKHEDQAMVERPAAVVIATPVKLPGKAGRERFADDEWARGQVHELGRPRNEVFKEWLERIDPNRRKLLQNPRDSFNKILKRERIKSGSNLEHRE